MNIEKNKIVDQQMCLSVPVSIEDNEYIEAISNSEGLTFKDLFAKMIKEHKKRGFTNDIEEVSEAEGSENSGVDKEVAKAAREAAREAIREAESGETTREEGSNTSEESDRSRESSVKENKGKKSKNRK